LPQHFDKTINLALPIIKVKAGASGPLETQFAHQRLGAVMPSSQRDTKFVCVCDQIMGVDPSQSKADQSSPLVSRTEDPDCGKR
jgi:hypothetical protein